MQQVTVRVPASTSNLGPGFDCLGVALCLYNSVTVVRGDGALSLPLVAEAARLFFRQAQTSPFPFSCTMSDNVARARGLGSSATVRAGVLLALNELTGRPLARSSIFELCAELEGHPDNAAPALFGGFTVVKDRSVQRFDVSSRLRFVLLIPELHISTPVARKILPQKVGRAAAVESCANACFITAAFASKNYATLTGAFRDGLHQPFRKKLMPFLPAVIAAAEKAGALGGFLSGSGSTTAALTMTSPKKIGDAMRKAAGRVPVRIVVTTADNRGAQVLGFRGKNRRGN
jgi:homoserine kinase